MSWKSNTTKATTLDTIECEGFTITIAEHPAWIPKVKIKVALHSDRGPQAVKIGQRTGFTVEDLKNLSKAITETIEKGGKKIDGIKASRASAGTAKGGFDPFADDRPTDDPVADLLSKLNACKPGDLAPIKKEIRDLCMTGGATADQGKAMVDAWKARAAKLKKVA